MLDPTNSFRLDGLPQVVIYGDNRDAIRFYALPTAPRIALDNQGKPLISLLIYGKREGTQVQPMGGQFIMTSTLALTSDEHTEITKALSQRLTREAQDKEIAPPPQPTVLNPEWLDGTVEVHLTAHLQLSGAPSMMGANECALQLSLGVADAKDLQKAWNDGLPDASISYQVQVNAARSSSTTLEANETGQTDQAGYTSRTSHSSTFQIDRAEAVRQPMTIEGPIALAQEELKVQLQVITVS